MLLTQRDVGRKPAEAQAVLRIMCVCVCVGGGECKSAQGAAACITLCLVLHMLGVCYGVKG